MTSERIVPSVRVIRRVLVITLALLGCGLGIAPSVTAMCIRRAPFQAGAVLQPLVSMPEWRTVAGYPSVLGTNDGAAVAARFSLATWDNGDGLGGIVASLTTGDFYVSDTSGTVIRRVTPGGSVVTVAGLFQHAGFRNGPAEKSLFNRPLGLAMDRAGNLFIADSGNNVIRMLSAAGVVTTFAGSTNRFGLRDGLGTNAWFNGPSGLTTDAADNLYVADTGNHAIRRVSPAGVVETLAGSGLPGFREGAGTNAWFENPLAAAVDVGGNVYVADSGNHVIRLISAGGWTTTLAGQPLQPGYADGEAGRALFQWPTGIAVGWDGSVLVTEQDNRTVRRIGVDGLVSTVGGLAPYDLNRFNAPEHADGLAPFVRFGGPISAAIDRRGRLLVTDADGTIRLGRIDQPGRVRILRQPIGLRLEEGSSAQLEVVMQNPELFTYQWLNAGVVIPGATNAAYAIREAQLADAGTYRVAVLDGEAYTLSREAVVSIFPPPGHDPLGQWHPIATAALGPVHGMAFGTGRYVAVSDSGAIMGSPDGSAWTAQFPVTSENLNGIAFGAGTFVSVGGNGVVLTSPDGQHWTVHSLTPEGTPNLNGVAFDQGLFVAVSGDYVGSVWTSADGIDWTNRGVGFGVSLMAVTAGNGQFVSVGNTILKSKDGIQWTDSPVPNSLSGENVLLTQVAYGDSRFVAMESTNSSGCSDFHGYVLGATAPAIEWKDITPTNGLMLTGPSFGQGSFTARDTHSGGFVSSPDGVRWTRPIPIPGSPSGSTPKVAFAQDLFVANYGDLAWWVSNDAKTWSLKVPRQAFSPSWGALTQLNGQYFWSGPGVETSSDGVNWRTVLTNEDVSWIAAGNGTLVAAGDKTFTSADNGGHWSETTPVINAQGASIGVRGLVVGNGLFLEFGGLSFSNNVTRGYVAVSADGQLWQQADLPSGTRPIGNIAEGGGHFVAITLDLPQGVVLTSSNGLTWQNSARLTSAALTTIAYGNGRFVVGGASVVLTSPDGLNWATRSVPGLQLDELIFGNGLFVGQADGRLLSSRNGQTWVTASGSFSPSTLTAGNGFFVALGYTDPSSPSPGSRLYQSGPVQFLDGPIRRPSGELEWTVSGRTQLSYGVEYSEDLRLWQPLATPSGNDAQSTFSDLTPGKAEHRFYRTVIR